MNSDPQQAQVTRRTFLAKLGRWFSWRRKRFYFITLPVTVVMAIVLTLVILFQIPGLKRHEWKIGSQVILAVDGWQEVPLENDNDSRAWIERQITIGPCLFSVSRQCGIPAELIVKGFSKGRMENWGGWCAWSNDCWEVIVRAGDGRSSD